MAGSTTAEKSFRTTIEGTEKGRVYVVLPFDPADVWGPRPRYHVAGTINGNRIRGAVLKAAKWHFLPLGPEWRKSAGLRPGDEVTVEIGAEGPQREALAADIAEALAAEPEAARFFDGLASFYRKGYLRWIDATKKRPDIRAERIVELVGLLKAGRKQRPR
ncbi:MAG TPA: YdeI/OmpD-associated family protein [Bryobacteraceae bacterium]